MIFKNNLTLILLVHDNTNLPQRWMEYASYINLPYKIFIADGGKTNDFNEYINKNKSHLKLDIEYFRYDHEECFSDFYIKSNDILNKVKTSYVAMCSDDDFFILSGIEKAINFLENNSEYSSARGEIMGIKFHNYINQDNIYGRSYVISYSSQVLSSLNHENNQYRLYSQLSDYQLTYFDIHKTKHLQFAYKKLVLLNPTSYILHEIITSGFTTLQGKVYRGSFPYLIRDHGPSGITHNEKENIIFLDWLTKSNWGAEYYSMINSFNQYITESHQTIVRSQDLHFAHLKYLRKELINNLYLKESMIIKIIVYFMTRIEVILNVKVLFLKITKIYKKLFYKIVIKNNLIIKNKKIAKSNYDFIKLIDFIRKNN